MSSTAQITPTSSAPGGTVRVIQRQGSAGTRVFGPSFMLPKPVPATPKN